MDRAKDNDWNPRGYGHTDKLANLTHEVNTDGKLSLLHFILN